jgi:hypothetical protein
MITGSWTEIAAAAAAFAIATLTAPAGLSGAVLLLPFQVSVLGTPIPDAIGDQIAATPAFGHIRLFGPPARNLLPIFSIREE